jgi:hypothetical protein
MVAVPRHPKRTSQVWSRWSLQTSNCIRFV